MVQVGMVLGFAVGVLMVIPLVDEGVELGTLLNITRNCRWCICWQ